MCTTNNAFTRYINILTCMFTVELACRENDERTETAVVHEIVRNQLKCRRTITRKRRHVKSSQIALAFSHCPLSLWKLQRVRFNHLPRALSTFRLLVQPHSPSKSGRLGVQCVSLHCLVIISIYAHGLGKCAQLVIEIPSSICSRHRIKTTASPADSTSARAEGVGQLRCI